MTVYFISGLGADKRIFKKLSLNERFTVEYVEWLEPLPKESLPDYCKRLSRQIDTIQKFSLVGLSFGGIIAIELSKILNPEKIILISSISCTKELPWYYKFIELIQLHKIIPASFLKKTLKVTFWFFGVKTNEEKELLKSILSDTSPTFLKWAINNILKWKNFVVPEKIFHIHGTEDHILPHRFTKADEMVEGGGHLMVYSKAEKISLLINQHIPSDQCT